MEHETEPAGADWPATGSDSTDERNEELAGVAYHGPGEPGRDADLLPDEVASTSAGTGEPRVDAALKLLDRLPGLPVSDHPELFEQVHAQLAEVLGELDSGPGGPVGPHGN
jgi:hypothetical protein